MRGGGSKSEQCLQCLIAKSSVCEKLYNRMHPITHISLSLSLQQFEKNFRNVDFDIGTVPGAYERSVDIH